MKKYQDSLINSTKNLESYSVVSLILYFEKFVKSGYLKKIFVVDNNIV